jgi:hypothetical protein
MNNSGSTNVFRGWFVNSLFLRFKRQTVKSAREIPGWLSGQWISFQFPVSRQFQCPKVLTSVGEYSGLNWIHRSRLRVCGLQSLWVWLRNFLWNFHQFVWDRTVKTRGTAIFGWDVGIDSDPSHQFHQKAAIEEIETYGWNLSHFPDSVMRNFRIYQFVIDWPALSLSWPDRDSGHYPISIYHSKVLSSEIEFFRSHTIRHFHFDAFHLRNELCFARFTKPGVWFSNCFVTFGCDGFDSLSRNIFQQEN